MEGEGLYVHSVSDNSHEVCFGPKFPEEAGIFVIHCRGDRARFEEGSLPLIVNALASGTPELDAFALFASLCMIGRHRPITVRLLCNDFSS